MSEPIKTPSRLSAILRKSIPGLALGIAVLFPSASSHAGAIRQTTVHTRSTVEIQKADPWSGYWANALKHHVLKLSGPSVHTVLTLSADGTLPSSPFVHYMVWREGLNAKRFDSFHSELAKMLHKLKTPRLHPGIPPETFVPPVGKTPILPPDFIPITTPQNLTPPNVPEPSTGLMAVGMIAAVTMGRRWAKRRG